MAANFAHARQILELPGSREAIVSRGRTIRSISDSVSRPVSTSGTDRRDRHSASR